MKHSNFVFAGFVVILSALAIAARAAAFEDLALTDFSTAEQPTAAGAPSPVAAAGLSVWTEPGGDMRVLTPRAAPRGLRVLPDETIGEELPVKPEVLPQLPQKGRVAPEMADISNIDPHNLIPADLKAAAVEYYRVNIQKLVNLRYVAVIDFARHSSEARFYVADLDAGTVKTYHVAHGKGSDPDRDGYATIFSNKASSLASSLGFYLTGEVYSGKHGRSMRLHGLSSTNSNAYARAVVIHAADYVADANAQPGRSWGCPAVSPASIDSVIDMLKGGALLYAGLSGAR